MTSKKWICNADVYLHYVNLASELITYAHGHLICMDVLIQGETLLQ